MSDIQLEQEDCYYSQGSELDLSRTTSLLNLQVLELQEVMQIIRKTIESVMDKCYLRQDNTIELLQYYDWRDDQVEQNYCLNQDELVKNLKAKGIYNDHSQISYLTQTKDACPVCFEENYLIQLGCLHKFCESCIQQTIQQKVKKEHSLIIRCLYDGCLYRMPYSMIVRYSRPEDLSNVLCRRFVENSPKLAYCTGVDCKKILLIHNLSEPNVICSCSNEFCFRCKSDFHPPAPCDLVKKWIHQITKDEANIKWIAMNTKICPFCKKPVEKSQGCNQLFCKPPGGCGQTFCYVCGNPWEPDHKDHFKCNKYVAPKNNQEKEKEMLARYNFYYERFLNSEQNYKQVQTKLKELKNSIFLNIFDIYQVSYIESQFIEESLQELLLSRRVLKWTYCYNYFVRQSNSTPDHALEYYEEQFEYACEQLAISLARFFDEVEKQTNKFNGNPLEILKTNFQNTKNGMRDLTTKTINMRKNLENAMKNGEIGL